MRWKGALTVQYYQDKCDILYFNPLKPLILLERLALYALILPLILFMVPIFYDPKEAHRSPMGVINMIRRCIPESILASIESHFSHFGDSIDHSLNEPPIHTGFNSQSLSILLI